jgi:molecular chaperone DnaK (HSP70)
LLEPDPARKHLRNAAPVQESIQIIQSLGKTPVDVVADYLRWLWGRIQDKIRDGVSNNKIFNNASVTVVMTVPASSSDEARDNTMQAAERVGIADIKLDN